MYEYHTRVGGLDPIAVKKMIRTMLYDKHEIEADYIRMACRRNNPSLPARWHVKFSTSSRMKSIPKWIGSPAYEETELRGVSNARMVSGIIKHENMIKEFVQLFEMDKNGGVIIVDEKKEEKK